MLELLIVSGISSDNPTQKHKKFDDAGGVIGRDLQADWVLHDASRQISSQHARVSFSQGCYFLLDISINGTYTGEGFPLHKGELHPLKLGDIYRIGSYQFKVHQLQQGNTHEVLKIAGLDHILSEPNAESTDEWMPFYDAEPSQQRAPLMLQKTTLNAFDFMPDPIDFCSRSAQKKDLMAAFRERLHLPGEAFGGMSEWQLQKHIFEILLENLNKQENTNV